MLTLREKFKFKEDTSRKLRSIAKPSCIALFSFVFCNFRLGECFFPIVLSVPASVESFLPLSLFASAAGIFVFMIGRNSLRYLSSLLLSGSLLFLFPDFFKGRQLLKSGFFALCLFATGIPFIFSDFSISLLFIYISEALICFAFSAVLKRCCEALCKEMPLNGCDFLAIGVTAAFLYISTADFKLLGLSVAKILSVSVIFAFVLHLSPAFSLSAGILLGLCGYIKGDILSILIFPAGAMASCAFLPAGKILSAAAFFSLSVFMVILKGVDESFIFLASEIAIGLLSGCFLPKSLFSPLVISKEKDMDVNLKNASSYQIQKTAKALDEIGSITEKVSKEFEKLHGEPMEKHIKIAVDKACRKCKNSPTCWQRYYDRTNEEVRKLFIDGKNGLPLDTKSFFEATECTNCGEIEKYVKEEACKYASFLRSRASSQNIRFIMCDQFSGFSCLLKALDEEVSKTEPLDEKERKGCEEILKSAGCLEKGCFAGKNTDGTYMISFLFPSASLQKISVKEITKALSEALKAPLAEPMREKEDDLIRLFWYTEPPFSVEFDYYQRASENKRICGDSFETAVGLSGNPLFFLSDGMGVGGDAAVDSAMTTCLLSRLMAAGASFPSALKLVSASLLSIKDERLCTVDFLSPDLYKGTLTFYKAGAAPSYLLREGRCFKISKSALPAGILGGAEAADSTFSLKNADLVLMVTDGITETGEDWILSSLPSFCDLTPIDICREIIDLAQKRSITGRCDDMTAAAIRFTKTI